jgi:Phage tail protein
MPTIFMDLVEAEQITFNQSLQQVCDVLDGWDGTPAPDTMIVQRGEAHGARASGVWRWQERYVTMAGAINAPTRIDAEIAKQHILNSFSPTEDHTLIRHEALTRQMFVRQYDVITFEHILPEGFRYTVPLIALDPLKYALTVESAIMGVFTGEDWYRDYPTGNYRTYDAVGFYRTYAQFTGATTYPQSASINNAGDAESRRVTIVMTGPLTGGDWTIINLTTGEMIYATIDIAAGQLLVFDMYNNQALLDGQDISPYVYGDWLHVVPGINTFQLTSSVDNVDAYATVSALSAWR